MRRDDRRIGYREAADFLGLPIGTVYQLVSNRQIPHVRLGRRLVRFERGRLRAWLDDRSIEVVRSEEDPSNADEARAAGVTSEVAEEFLG